MPATGPLMTNERRVFEVLTNQSSPDSDIHHIFPGLTLWEVIHSRDGLTCSNKDFIIGGFQFIKSAELEEFKVLVIPDL